MLDLLVIPNEPPMSWEDCISKYGSYIIAVDGFVKEGPRKDLSIPALNLNHHEEVPRYETLATCQQALDKVREGLFRNHFVRGGQPYAKVLANDCDEDVCTTWAILNNSYMFEDSANPRINKLVDVEGRLDRTAGAYPYHPDMPFLEIISWVYYPFTLFKNGNGLIRRDAREFTETINMVESRIIRYIAGDPQRLPIDTKYTQVGGDKTIALVKDVGQFNCMP